MLRSRQLLPNASSAAGVGLHVALAVFYAVFAVGVLRTHGLFDYMGGDYLAFHTSAEIARRYGFSQVYDPALQEQFQRRAYEELATGPLRSAYATVPAPLPLVFFLPFVPFSFLSPGTGFVLWTVLNGVGLALYLGRLSKAGLAPGLGPLATVVLSVPVFATLFFGQVSILILICVGEFFLSSLRGQDGRAGIWLAGLLIKPQLLILLLPGLLLGRRWRALLSFAPAALAILGTSALLAGRSGVFALGQLLVGFAQSQGSRLPYPEFMMNWRALAVNLLPAFPPVLAWGLAIAGMVLTAMVALAMWVWPRQPTSEQFALALLGTTAATCATTWHAHIHAALILVPALLLLWTRGQGAARAVLRAWLLIPAWTFLVVALAAPAVAHQALGLTTLAANVGLVIWAAAALWAKPHLRRPAGRGVEVVE